MADETVSRETYDLIESDPFADWLGIELRDLEPGYAKVTLTLTDNHMNFHGTPHGGLVYALADSAFAAASNASGETEVALETNMSYLSVADVGTTLRAIAERTHESSRTEEYQAFVETADDDRLATFRGRTYKP